MLFRDTHGKLILINKKSYKNDILYYKTIMKTIFTDNNDKCDNNIINEENQLDSIVDTISQIIKNKK